jgi:CRISPR-associated protein Cmr1
MRPDPRNSIGERILPGDTKAVDRAGYITETREYELITPLFGGGVKTKEADPITVIRGSSIRGHLRFWWRATRGGLFHGRLADLAKREGEVWGTVTGENRKPLPSGVSLEVLVLSEGKDQLPFVLNPGANFPTNNPNVAPGYAAFPIQPNTQDRTLRPVRGGVKFQLKISYPIDFEADLEAAMWAWETFGGIGGRTRRGFGALHRLNSGEPVVINIEQRLKDGFKRHVVSGTWPGGVPYLRRAQTLVCKGWTWKAIIDEYRAFRQWRTNDNPDLEQPNPRNPGRSRWPEPDAIRHFTRRTSQKHRQTIYDNIHIFPRAVFGLPIITHFKTGHQPDEQGEPQDVSLQGVNSDRLASPLILRPCRLENDLDVVVTVLGSPRTPPGGLMLKNTSANRQKQNEYLNPPIKVGHIVTQEQSDQIEPLGQQPNPLESFLEFLLISNSVFDLPKESQ